MPGPARDTPNLWPGSPRSAASHGLLDDHRCDGSALSLSMKGAATVSRQPAGGLPRSSRPVIGPQAARTGGPVRILERKHRHQVSANYGGISMDESGRRACGRCRSCATSAVAHGRRFLLGPIRTEFLGTGGRSDAQPWRLLARNVTEPTVGTPTSSGSEHGQDTRHSGRGLGVVGYRADGRHPSQEGELERGDAMKASTSANETALEAEVDLFAAASDPIRIVPLQLPPQLPAGCAARCAASDLPRRAAAHAGSGLHDILGASLGGSPAKRATAVNQRVLRRHPHQRAD